MAKLFWKIFLCIFIKSLIFCSANGVPHSSLPSTSTNEKTETHLNDGTTAPLIREGPPPTASVTSVNGDIKTIRDQVVARTIQVITPVTVHATLENATYLLVNQTQNDETDILVYKAVENTSTYLLVGSLITSTNSAPAGKMFNVDRLEDIIDVSPTNMGEPVSQDQRGGYTIEVSKAFRVKCPELVVRNLLYRKSNPNVHVEFPLSGNNPQNLFDPSKKTTILIHGWREDGTQPGKFSQILKDAILTKEDQNVFVISWTASLIYPCSIKEMKPVSDMVASFVTGLVKKSGANLGTFHIMGHGLGGHMVGFVARNIKAGRVPRITGFDPAHPLIPCISILFKTCIDKSDAEFVEVVHTDGGRAGKSQALGHVDFYPNGGVHSQPHCGKEPILTVCSHAAGFTFYEEAILNAEKGPKFDAAKSNSYEDFKQGKCTGRIEFGPNATKEPGLYYFTTSPTTPYAKGEKGLGDKCLASIPNKP